MHRRYDQNHIPIELLRTFVAIEAEGNFTKAGAALGLTQSAVSAQVRRFEQLVGGDVFAKSGGGLSLTPLGASIAQYARRILQLNDQILSLPGAQCSKQLVRIGIPTALAQVLLRPVFQKCGHAAKDRQVHLRCDASGELGKGIEDGYLDIAILLLTRTFSLDVVDEWLEPMVWGCSPDLVVSPNQRIPYISWPNSPADDIAIGALERTGRRYVVSFAASDFYARSIAALAGLGYMLLPQRAVVGGLKVARESFLPAVPPVRAGVAVRRDFKGDLAVDLLRTLVEIARPAEPAAAVLIQSTRAELQVQR